MGLEAGSMQPVSQDLCCACCQAPLVLRDSCFAPSLPPLRQHCYPCQVLTSRLLHEAFLDPYVPSGQPVHRFMDYRLQAGVVSDRLVPRNACVRLFSGSFWQCFGRDFDLLLIPSPNPCASLRFEGPNPNLQSPVQHPSQDANTVKEANLLQAGHPCDPVVPRCMSSDPSSSPSVALGFRPDSAAQPPLLLGTQALGPAPPLPVAIGFRPDSAVQPPHVQGTVSDSVLSGMLPQAAGPLHNVNSSGVVPSLRAHRAGAEAGCGGESPDCAGQEQLSFELPAPSASFHTADPNFILLRGDWQELHPDSCVAPGVCSVCQQEPVLGLAVDQEVQKFMHACSKAHQVAPREELHVAMHDAMSYCPHCLCVWEANLRKYRQRVAVHAELSRPSYFVDFEEAQELDDQDGSARMLCSEQAPQLQAKAVSGSGCRLGVPSSRRARRRYNRRLRRDAANQHHQVSLDSLIEPLPFEQGAPKTPAEEVETGSWKFCQEVVGRWPGGLGGPTCLPGAVSSVHSCGAPAEPLLCTATLAEASAASWHNQTTPGVSVSTRTRGSCNRRWRLASQRERCAGDPHNLDASEGTDVVQPLTTGSTRWADGAPASGTLTRASHHTHSPNLISDVRRDGGTRSDSCAVLSVSGRAMRRAPATPIDASPIAAGRQHWISLQDGLKTAAESKVVQAIAALEDGGHLVQETFPRTAAEMALNAVQDSCTTNTVPAAAAALQDVLCNLNATVWRPALAGWCAEQRPDLILVQETHLVSGSTSALHQQMGVLGYRVTCAAASHTGKGGTTGGLAIFHKNHLDVRFVTEHLQDGAGFTAVALRVKGCDLFIVTVYLKSGEGFQSEANAALLGHLDPCLRSVQGIYFAAGDYNEDLQTLIDTRVAAEAKGTWVGPGCPTLTGGGQIDFALVSRSLGPVTTVSLDWATPFKPHAALRWQLDVGALSTSVPQLCSFRPMEPNPRPFELGSAKVVPFLLDLPVDSALTLSFAKLSQAVEFSVYGDNQGRGVRVYVHRSPLPVQGKPLGTWGGKQAALWSRVISWISTTIKAGRPPHNPPQKLLCQLRDSGLLDDQGGRLLLEVLQQDSDQLAAVNWEPHLVHAAAQHKLHAAAWVKHQSVSYEQWLRKATHSGMQPLFRCVRKHEDVFDRPFRDKSLLDRIYHRWEQWHQIWCQNLEHDPALFAQLREKALDQAQAMEPIPLQEAVHHFKRMPLKAPGMDGWNPQMLRRLSEPAVAAVLDFFRQCELRAEWPAQFAINLIVLLPKSIKRERPIALLHVLYRSYIRLRWFLVSQWQISYSRIGVWDKATPGSGVLDVALSRLMRGEVTRHRKEHLCTLFMDLETFYDRCRFPNIIQSGFALSFPPVILHMALLIYRGPRFLSGENTIAPPIVPSTGVLAGCPAAPAIAKLVIHPIASQLVQKPGAINLDVWVDDLSLDSVSPCPKMLASSCVRLYRGLCASLTNMGAKVSLDKTCFVASSAAAAKALNAVRRPDDPQVKPLARDLGITSNGARRRTLGLAATRRAKAGTRAKKFNSLGVKTVGHRIRICKGSILSAGLWGHQAIGVSPKRRKWYRTMCAQHLGRQALGSLDLTFAMFSSRCEDPHFTILRQHFRAVARVFASWTERDPAKLESTWTSLWHHLSNVPYFWRRVTGPISATIAYLKDLGVTCEGSKVWRHGQKTLYLDWANPDVTRSAWQWLEAILLERQRLAIATQEGCGLLADGIDFTVPRRLSKIKHFHKHTRTGLMAVWQGALPSSSISGWCSLCQCQLTLQHALWDCPFTRRHFPEHFEKERQRYPWPSLWLRGLPPLAATTHPAPEAALLGTRASGVFWNTSRVSSEGLVFASDASAGPGGSDCRLLFTCWAIGAYRLEPEGPVRVGHVTHLMPYSLSVPQAEQHALFELFQRVPDAFDVTIDCKSVQQLLQRAKAPWGARYHGRLCGKIASGPASIGSIHIRMPLTLHAWAGPNGDVW